MTRSADDPVPPVTLALPVAGVLTRVLRDGLDRALVADRLDTQFVGSPRTVVERLKTLRRVSSADELLVTTITHSHNDRVRSFELLAKHWPG